MKATKTGRPEPAGTIRWPGLSAPSDTAALEARIAQLERAIVALSLEVEVVRAEARSRAAPHDD